MERDGERALVGIGAEGDAIHFAKPDRHAALADQIAGRAIAGQDQRLTLGQLVDFERIGSAGRDPGRG